ncbi:MAG: hypothetical protein IPH36_19700 [Saprospiraceae bacterium]|nr:hypothetical protein [Saprospiraceae bacterium]
MQKSDVHMDVRALERCLVYLNSVYRGVYTLSKNQMITTTPLPPMIRINTTCNAPQNLGRKLEG